MTQERNLPQNLNDEIIKMYEELRKLQTDLAKLAKEFYEQSVVSYDEVSGTPTDLSFFNNDMNFISEEEVDQKIGSIPPPDDSNYLKKEDEGSQKCSVVTTFTDLKATTQEQDDSSDNVATTKFVHQLVKDSSEDTKQYVSGIYQSNKGITSEQVETAIQKAIVKYDEEENVEQKIEDAVSAIVVPTKVSDLQNDSGFITIGQVPGDLVTSVNGQTGNVTVQVPTVPTNVSSFTNDAGYITDAGVTSVNNQTGAVFVQENVQANWSSTSGPSVILNKPALKRVATTGDYDDLDNKPDLSVYAQTNDLATVATTGDYGDLTNTPTIPTVPTNVSDFTNDAGYLTSYTETDPTVPSWAKAASKPSYDYSEIANTPNIPTVPTNVSAFTNDAGYLTQHQDISGKADSASLATVATSGSYNDLTDTPTIPVDSNLVHKDGSENITGEKTFVGTKRVKFKQGANSDKLGFTCYTRTNVECGNFEVLPNDRAVNLGIYDVTNTPASDWVVGFKCQAKDSNGTMHKFGFRAPSRLGNATYTEYYIPAAVNGVYADKSGNITLDASSGIETTSNKVTSLSASNTDDEYPTAKCIYDALQNIQSQIQQLSS